MDQMKVIEAYARLNSLKSNLPNTHTVHEKYVREFGDICSLLQQLSGVDLNSFKIPSSELQRRLTSSNYRTGKSTYTDDLYCDRAFLMMKTDGVINLFDIYLSSQKTGKSPIGFNPPNHP
jgi:hypothetical protein